MSQKEAWVYTNDLEEQGMIYPLLQEANIPFVEFGPTSEEGTPYLEYNHFRFDGIDAIKDFVEQWKKEERAIKKVVREWMERMRRAYETRQSGSSDYDIDCPVCGGCRDISYYPDKGWQNTNRDCSFTFPGHLMPPTPDEFRAYLEHEGLQQRIEMFLNSE